MALLHTHRRVIIFVVQGFFLSLHFSGEMSINILEYVDLEYGKIGKELSHQNLLTQ